MPRPTFHALPEAKRSRILDAALDEFEHGYDLASITRLVARLGIAKGSIYQYFDDKFDLFSHLLTLAGERKAGAVLSTGSEPAGSVFDEMRAMYVRGLAFWRSDPRWARLASRVVEPSREPRMERLRVSAVETIHRYLREWIETGVARGEVRADVDPDLAAHFVRALLTEGLRDALLARSGLSLAELPSDPLEIDDAALLEVADMAVGLLERGLGAAPGR